MVLNRGPEPLCLAALMKRNGMHTNVTATQTLIAMITGLLSNGAARMRSCLIGRHT